MYEYMCPKYAQHILTGLFETPLSTPVRIHITNIFLFEVKVYTHLGRVRKILVIGLYSL